MGVDDAAAVAGDAGGVGNDELGAGASHFHRAVQLGGGGAVDFVEDDFGGAGGQPGVALDGARQVGLGRGAGVVEDGALWGDVKLLVGVAGDARWAGGLDVDQGAPLGAVRMVGRCWPGAWGSATTWAVAMPVILTQPRLSQRAKGMGWRQARAGRCAVGEGPGVPPGAVVRSEATCHRRRARL